MRNDPVFAQALPDEAITLLIGGEPGSVGLIHSDGVDAVASDASATLATIYRVLQGKVRGRAAIV